MMISIFIMEDLHTDYVAFAKIYIYYMYFMSSMCVTLAMGK